MNTTKAMTVDELLKAIMDDTTPMPAKSPEQIEWERQQTEIGAKEWARYQQNKKFSACVVRELMRGGF